MTSRNQEAGMSETKGHTPEWFVMSHGIGNGSEAVITGPELHEAIHIESNHDTNARDLAERIAAFLNTPADPAPEPDAYPACGHAGRTPGCVACDPSAAGSPTPREHAEMMAVLSPAPEPDAGEVPPKELAEGQADNWAEECAQVARRLTGARAEHAHAVAEAVETARMKGYEDGLNDPGSAWMKVRRQDLAKVWDEALRWVRRQADVTTPEYAIDRIDRAEPFNPYRAAQRIEEES